MAITDYRLCCGYGNSGTDARGFDCLVIPGAMSQNGNALNGIEFCGASKGLVSMGTITADATSAQPGGLFNKTICCKIFVRLASQKPLFKKPLFQLNWFHFKSGLSPTITNSSASL
jgi:hypothetical protein